VAANSDLADKLTRLMEAAGNPATERLAQEIAEATGHSISGAYLWQIKKGRKRNLTLVHLTALSGYFTQVLDVPITLSYFDPATPVDEPWTTAQERTQVAELQRRLAEEQKLTQALADHGVQRIASRYGTLSAAERRQVLAIVETFGTPPDR
jgi:transcriptional regulator with XRE-family HTH domain